MVGGPGCLSMSLNIQSTQSSSTLEGAEMLNCLFAHRVLVVQFKSTHKVLLPRYLVTTTTLYYEFSHPIYTRPHHILDRCFFVRETIVGIQRIDDQNGLPENLGDTICQFLSRVRRKHDQMQWISKRPHNLIR
jgi:hypothetical protein